MKDIFNMIVAPIAVALALYSLSTVSALESKTSVNAAIIDVVKERLDDISGKLDKLSESGCR